MEKSFSKKGALNFGWNKFKKHTWYFIGLMLIMFLFSGVFSYVSDDLEGPVAAILSIILYFVDIIIGMGLIAIAICVCDDKYPTYDYLFSQKNKLLNYIAGAILYTMMVVFGLILFIIPGFIWGVKYGLYYFLIIDKNLKPLDALAKSRDITDGIKWDLFVFYLLLVLINILGALMFVVGLFITIPVTTIAMAHVYRGLYAQTEFIEKGT